MLQPSLFWVVLNSEEPTGGTIKALAPPEPGDKIHLTDGTPCVIGRVGPAPAGSHVVMGTIYANRS